jgi:25S rRNA (adenine2142-N1)-methyltransferase
MGSKKKRSVKQLSASRPPTSRKPVSMSRKASRSIINAHHSLEKQRRLAASRDDVLNEAKLAAQISQLGGLKLYQQASLQGQRADRGGDSSITLLQWLNPIQSRLENSSIKLRMLEVGALSAHNACSKCSFLGLERIDLRSQETGIQQQDFMLRPLPENDSERFDIISLSLVLNYVPDAAGRGCMLERSREFLRDAVSQPAEGELDMFLPSLFIVLPRSCIANSRYFSDERFLALMTLLGYSRIQVKYTQKLVYYLWKKEAISNKSPVGFSKKEVFPGRFRNNFHISLPANPSMRASQVSL